MKHVGRKLWVIAEGYVPATSTGPEPEMTSHETACILTDGFSCREQIRQTTPRRALHTAQVLRRAFDREEA